MKQIIEIIRRERWSLLGDGFAVICLFAIGWAILWASVLFC